MQRVEDPVIEAVVDDRHAIGGDGDPVGRPGGVEGEHQDHLQPWEGAHQLGVLGSEADEVLGRDEGEVHAGLEQKPVRGREVVTVVALGVTEEAFDPVGVLADQDQGRVQGDEAAEGPQLGAETRGEEKGRRAEGPAGEHHDLGPDPVLALRPGRAGQGQDLAAVAGDPQHPAAGDHLDAGGLGGGELDDVGSLLGAVRAAQVAQSRAAAALDVERELPDPVTQGLAAGAEQPVVLVDLLGGQEMNVVLVARRAGPPVEVVEVELGHRPAVENLTRHAERGAGVHHGGPAERPSGGQRQGAVAGQDAAGVDEQPLGHLQLVTVAVLGLDPVAPLQHGDRDAGGAEPGQGLGDRAATGSRADDHHVDPAFSHCRGPLGEGLGARSRVGATPRAVRRIP